MNSNYKNLISKFRNTFLHKSKLRAFTLVELLVVVAIIGILGTVIVVSVSNAQKKARDSRRKGDVAIIEKAANYYYTVLEKDTYVIKMKNGDGVGWCSAISPNCGGGNGYFNFESPQPILTSSGYWRSIAKGFEDWGLFPTAPIDPSGGTNSGRYYAYYASSTKFSVYANLEIPNVASECSSVCGTTSRTAKVDSGSSPGSSCNACIAWNYRRGNGY